MSDRLVVLSWHNVDRSWLYPMPAGAGARGFARQLATLRRLGTIVPLAGSLDALAAGRPLPRRPIALTFDDGYQDNLDLAAPILERLGLPATFFLVPHLLDGKVRHMWELVAWAFARAARPAIEWEGHTLSTRPRDRERSLRTVIPRLRRLPWADLEPAVDALLEQLEPAGDPAHVGRRFLDGDGALELVRRGFEIGSHTLRHGSLTCEQPEVQQQELTESRSWLERALDVPVATLAYPNGRAEDFDETTVAAAEAAGYRHSLTTQFGRNRSSTPAHELRRIVLLPERGFPAMAAQRVWWRALRLARRPV